MRRYRWKRNEASKRCKTQEDVSPTTIPCLEEQQAKEKLRQISLTEQWDIDMVKYGTGLKSSFLCSKSQLKSTGGGNPNVSTFKPAQRNSQTATSRSPVRVLSNYTDKPRQSMAKRCGIQPCSKINLDVQKSIRQETKQARIHSSSEPRRCNPCARIKQRHSEPYLVSKHNQTVPASLYARTVESGKKQANSCSGHPQQVQMTVDKRRRIAPSQVGLVPQKDTMQRSKQEPHEKESFLNSNSPFIRQFLQLNAFINSERRSIFLPIRPTKCKKSIKISKRSP